MEESKDEELPHEKSYSLGSSSLNNPQNKINSDFYALKIQKLHYFILFIKQHFFFKANGDLTQIKKFTNIIETLFSSKASTLLILVMFSKFF